MDEQTTKQIHELYQQLHQVEFSLAQLWVQKTLWTWRWWLTFIGTVVTWPVWIFVRKKRATHRLLFVGFFIMLLASLTDMIGTSMGLWEYPIHVFPLIPPFLPWDLCYLPVVTMLFLQVKPKSNPYLKALIYGFLGSYVLENIAQSLDLYSPLHWKHFYTFAVLFVMYLVAHGLSKGSQFEPLATDDERSRVKKDGESTQ